MADALNFSSDFGGVIDDLIKLNDQLGKFDLTAENVTQVVTRLSDAGLVLDHTLNALGPSGEKITLRFATMTEEMAKVSNNAFAAAGDLDLVAQSIKRVNDTPVNKRSDDLKAVSAGAIENVLARNSINPIDPSLAINSNKFANELAAVERAAQTSKASVDELFNLIGKSQAELANAGGNVRGFADALHKLGNALETDNLGFQAGKGLPGLIPIAQNEKNLLNVSNNLQAIGSAAAKAGVDSQTLDTLLQTQPSTLARITGAYADLAQAIIKYKIEIDKANGSATIADRADILKSQAQGFIRQTDQVFFPQGAGALTNTEEAAKAKALNDLNKALIETGQNVYDFDGLLKRVANGGGVALTGSMGQVTAALLKVQTVAQAVGKTQQDAIAEDQRRARSLEQLATASNFISQIKNQLPVPTGADRESVNSFTAALARLQAQVGNTALTAVELNKVFKSAIAGSGDVFQGEAGKIQSGVAQVLNGYSKLSDSGEELKKKVKEQESAITAFFSRVGSQITTILINQLYHAFTQGVESARQFSLAIVQSQAITQGAGTTYEELSQQVLKVSNAFGLARADVAEGLFQTLKHEIGDTAQSAQFLAEAAQFARLSHGSFIDSVQLGTAAINSFGLQGKDAREVYEALFEAIKSGRLSTSELANTLGTLGTIGNSVGISLEETTAALSALTHAGVNAATAQTFLRNLFKELITPTKAFNELLNDSGFPTGKAAAETLHLVGVLNLLQTSANGNIAVTGKYVENLRGIQALLGLTGDKFDTFVHQLNKNKDAQSDYAKGLKVTFESNAQAFTEFQNQIANNSLGFSDALVSAGGFIVKALGGATNAVSAFREVLIGFTVGGIVVAIGSISAALAALGTTIGAVITGALLSVPGIIAVSLGAVAFTIAKIVAYADEAEAKIAEDAAKAQEAFTKAQNEITKTLKLESEKQLQGFNIQVASLQRVYSQLKDIIVSEMEEASVKFRNIVDLDLKHRTDAINLLKSEQTKAENEINNLTKEKAEGVLKIQDTIFEEKLRELSLASQIEDRQIRAQDLIKAAINDNASARKAAANGDIENAIKLEQISKREFEDASKQLDKVAQASLKIKDLSKGYITATTDFLKKEFELEVKVINDSEKRVLETFKRVKDAVKDIFDKTGDSSGESGKFLKNYTAQLTTFLNELRQTQGRVRISTRGSVEIDPDLRSVLQAVDPKTIRRLRVAIQVGDQESLKRILGDMELIKKKQDEIAKARLANIEEGRAADLAQAERRNNNFENERKFLKESLDFAVKSEAQGFKSAITVRQEMDQIQQRIIQSYKDEATVKGAIKKNDELAFNAVVSTADVVQKQLNLMNEQVNAQVKLQNVLASSAASLETQRKAREEELVNVRTLFQELEKVKGTKEGVVTPEEVKAAEDFLNKIKEGKDKGFKFDDPAILFQVEKDAIEKVQTLKNALRLKDNKEALESARVQVEDAEKVRLKSFDAIRNSLNQLNRSTNAFDIGGLTEAIKEKEILVARLSDPKQNALAVPKNVLDSEKETLAELKDDLANAVEGTIRFQALAANYSDILTRLKENKLTEADAKTLAILTGDDAKKFSLNIEEKKKELSELGKKLGLDLNKVIEPTLKLDGFESGIKEMRRLLQELGDDARFGIQFNRLQNEPQRKFHGGVVYGQNGIDAIPARLSAGETVIDSKNSARFFNQLSQIRAGNAPTSNNSSVAFGGVNINLQSTGNAKVDAREIFKEFKRLEARGVI